MHDYLNRKEPNRFFKKYQLSLTSVPSTSSIESEVSGAALRGAETQKRPTPCFLSAEEAVNNPSEFVCRGCDRLGFAEFPSDPPKELAEIIFGVMLPAPRFVRSFVDYQS